MKCKVILWEKKNKEDMKVELESIDIYLKDYFEPNLGGSFFVEKMHQFKVLEERNNKILEDKEATWRFKSREI